MKQNWNPHTLLVEIYNGAAAVGNSWWFLKVKNRVSIQSIISIPRVYWDEKWKHMPTQKLVSECSPQFYSQKLQEETQMPINRWISKTWYIHTIEYYSAMKRNEALIHAPRMNSESIMLNERCQICKTTHTTWLHLYEISNPERQRTVSGYQGLEEGMWLLNAFEVYVWDNEKALEPDSDVSWKTLWVYLLPSNCTL